MNYVKVKLLPRPHNIEFKQLGRLIFDINYVEHLAPLQFTGMAWRNSKGQLHRENGPAIIWDDGDREWFCYNKPHREDGPAAIYPSDGRQFWCLNDIEYSEEKFNEEIRRRNELRERKNLTKTI